MGGAAMSVAGSAIAVLGGDRRMAEAAAGLAALGARVWVTHLPGDAAPPGCIRCGSPDEALSGAGVVLLPVQAVEPDGRLHTEGALPALYIRPEALDRLAPGAVIFAGLASETLRTAAADRKRTLVEYRDRDDFAIYNSVPSAEGALQMAMEASPLCLFDSQSLVVGFGRTGVTMAQMLRGIGAHVTVAAQRETELARIYACGYRPLALANLTGGMAETDFVFNTVPALVVTRSALARAPRHQVIVDLASAPGGVDFTAAEQFGIKALLAPGLPGKVAPVTAGRIVATLVVRYLSHREERA